MEPVSPIGQRLRRFGGAGVLIILGRTLLNPTSGSLERDLIERVYIPKGPPNPNSQIVLTLLTTVMSAVADEVL